MKQRLQVLFGIFTLMIGAVIMRLFYWQIVSADELKEQASEQHIQETTISPKRGEIIASDGFPLVFNEPRYSVDAYIPNVEEDPGKIADTVLEHVEFKIDDPEIATDEAKREKEIERLESETKLSIIDKLTSRSWARLYRDISVDNKESLQDKGIKGLSYEEFFIRHYPEASMSAHVLGFVGKDDIGSPVGYFGLEGYYDRELRGSAGILKQEKDALGRPLLTATYKELSGRDGRDLILHLDRGLQYIAENELKDALELYGASSGEVVIIDPKTGGILAMSALPSYDPSRYWTYETSLYKNPIVANTYEPGSTFKVLVMAAALEEGKVKLDDKCDICAGPVNIGKYTIKTWDGTYEKDRSPEDIIIHSDNTGMVWTQQKLGGDKLVEYIEKFGFGQKTGIDIQEEVGAPLRSRWGDIDHATASFGQGIAVTSIQMVRAVGAIANGGILIEPHVVDKVVGDEEIKIETKEVRRVVSEDTANEITDMMVKAVDQGEAKWTRVKDYEIAGKTGTAQIPVSGHYDEEKTIASFVGFAPARDPQFAMLVKLREPTSSPWGSETAAPLWFNIARRALVHLNIPPTQ